MALPPVNLNLALAETSTHVTSTTFGNLGGISFGPSAAQTSQTNYIIYGVLAIGALALFLALRK
jgi:hypothetical protein